MPWDSNRFSRTFPDDYGGIQKQADFIKKRVNLTYMLYHYPFGRTPPECLGGHTTSPANRQRSKWIAPDKPPERVDG